MSTTTPPALTIWAHPRALAGMNTSATQRFCGLDRRTLGRMIAAQRPASHALIALAVHSYYGRRSFDDLFHLRPAR